MKSTLLHIGCSLGSIVDTTPGFQDGQWNEIRLDIDPAVQPDMIGSICDLSKIANNSIDAIYSSHNIEHIYHHQVPQALSEMYRVLHSSGFLILTCPDLQSICSLVVNDQLEDPAYMSAVGPITPLDVLFGYSQDISKGNEFMAHKTGFTKSTITKHVLAAHFEDVITFRRPKYFDLWVLATKSKWTTRNRKKVLQAHFGHFQREDLA